MFLSPEIQLGTQSAYARELAKWEAHFTQYGPPGRPYVYRDYPTLMYKPTRSKSTGEVTYEGQTAETEHERTTLERIGFVWGGKAAALEKLEAREFEIAEAAAERAYQERRMSAKAQSEADAVDSTTISHLGEIQETPIRRGPGRPRKVVNEIE